MKFDVDAAGYLILDGKPVDFQRTPNQSGPFKEPPRFTTMHYTAGRSRASTVTHFLDPKAQASAHLVIGRDGSITQMATFTTITWHAGVSQWTQEWPLPDGAIGPPRTWTSLNFYAIGIELDNAGKLMQAADGNYYTYWGEKVPQADVIIATHKNELTPAGWQRFPTVQLDTAQAIVETLFHAYPSLKELLGHDDIAPARKVDPGPAFPLASWQARLYGRQTDEPQTAPQT